MSTTTIEIEKLLPWNQGEIKQTARGVRLLRTASPTEDFWKIWRANKAIIKAAGINVSQYNGIWTVSWWCDPPADFMREVTEKVQASYKKASDISIPAPEGCEYMPYQKAAVEFAMNRTGTLFGDEMGLGKTIEAIGVVNNDPTIQNVLVICPARLRINWKRELTKWLVRPMTVSVANGTLAESNVVIIAYTTVAKFSEQLNARKWDLIVMDEIHYIKNPDAQRTVAVTNLAKNTARKIGMTGTPIQNRVAELFTVLNLLDPQTWGDRSKFMNRYVRFCNDNRMAELQRLLRTSVMIRRLKKDVLPELPAKRRQSIVIPPTGYEAVLQREREVMARWEQQLVDAHVELELAKASGNEDEYLAAVARIRRGNSVAFEEISRVRHETALAKVPAVIEHIQDLLEATSEKVVVFAHHIDVLEQIHAAFPGAGLLHGQRDMNKGQADVDRFQEDPNCRIMVCSILAGGLGLNMTAGTVAVFAELDWVPTNLDQAESRLHRKGQLNAVMANYIILEDSLDHRMVDILLEKLAIIDAAMGDSKDINAPLFPNLGEHAEATGPITITMADYMEANTAMPQEQLRAIHTCLRMLSGVCDGAVQLDGQGFNKLDSAVGKRLAALPALSPRQALLGQKFCKRYHRQLPADLLAVAVGTPAPAASNVPEDKPEPADEAGQI